MLGSGVNRALYLLQCCSSAKHSTSGGERNSGTLSDISPPSFARCQLISHTTTANLPFCLQQTKTPVPVPQQAARGLTPWQTGPAPTRAASPALSGPGTGTGPPWLWWRSPAPCPASRSFPCQSAPSHWQWRVPLLQGTPQHQLSPQHGLQLHKIPEELSIFSETDLWTQGSR